MKKKKPVSPKKYDKDYYLTNCGGYEEFNKSLGKKLPKRISDTLKNINVKKGDKILDIGCGRGETAFYLAKKGAYVVGIDYSEEAIKLAKKALKKQPQKIQKLIEFKVMNAKKLDFDRKSFDKVIMLEVWEHVYSFEQEMILNQIHKILKKHGKAYIHTEPSKLINDILYPYWIYPISSVLINVSNFLSKNNYAKLPNPKLIRDELSYELHVNEPTYWNINYVLMQSKFDKYNVKTDLEYLKPEISWKDKAFNFLTQFYPLSKYPPLNMLFANSFFITLTK